MENDLERKEGIEKIRKIIEGSPIGMMATNLAKTPFSVCPMTTQEVDDQGDLCFFSNRQSDHFKDIEQDNRVQILYSNDSKQEYLSVFGNAVHVVDDYKVDQLWNPMLKSWFEGKNDPDLVLLSVSIDHAHYWDTKANKLVSLIKMAKSAVTGNETDVGEKGHIDLQNY